MKFDIKSEYLDPSVKLQDHTDIPALKVAMNTVLMKILIGNLLTNLGDVMMDMVMPKPSVRPVKMINICPICGESLATIPGKVYPEIDGIIIHGACSNVYYIIKSLLKRTGSQNLQYMINYIHGDKSDVCDITMIINSVKILISQGIVNEIDDNGVYRFIK